MFETHLLRTAALTTILAFSALIPALAQEVISPTTRVTSAPEAGIEQINQAIETLTAELMQSLNPTGTYAVKSADDSTEGVPSDLLVQITSSLQSSLMLASDFKITLIDQAQLQESWSNAVEFNGADFEQLIESANFDALIVLNTRATASSIELSLQVIGATGDNSGQIIASSAIISAPIDWMTATGVDVSGVNEDIASIREELEKLQNLDNTIASPKNWIEFYSNSQKFKNQRNIDAALSSLESALLGKPEFFDPAFDFASIVKSRYGTVGAQKYFTTRLSGKIKPTHEDVIRVTLGINETPLDGIGSSFNENPVLAAVWFWSEGQTLLARRNADFSKSILIKSKYDSYDLDFYLLKAIRAIVAADMDGSLSGNFFNVSLQESIARMPDLLGVEEQINRVEYSISTVGHKFGRGDAGFRFDSSAAFPNQSKLIDIKPLSVLGHPWYTLGWERYQSEMESFGDYRHTGICGLDVCGVDRLINGAATLPTCKSYSPTTPEQSANLLASMFDASTDGIYKTDFEVDQTNENGDDHGHLYKSDAPLIPPRYADLCIVADSIVAHHNFEDPTNNGIFEIFGPSDLVITDDVDLSKPVLLTFSTRWGMEDTVDLTVDITKDGTSFYKSGFPLKVNRYQDHEAFGSQFTQGWLYAPSWIESALFTENLASVSYTDKLGRFKSLDNIFTDKTDLHVPSVQVMPMERLANFSQGRRLYLNYEEKQFSNYSSPAQKFEQLVVLGSPRENGNYSSETHQTSANPEVANGNSSDSSQPWISVKDAVTCFPVLEQAYTPANINEYVSMRSHPSIEAPPITRIEKGEILYRSDENVYFTPNDFDADFCKEICVAENKGNSFNASALSTCTEKNLIWYKLKSSSGDVGFISGKFLAFGRSIEQIGNCTAAEGSDCDGCDEGEQQSTSGNSSEYAHDLSSSCSDHGASVFSCQIEGSSKQLSLCVNSDGVMRYRFGPDLKSPEIELFSNAKGNFDGFNNYGAGQSIWHEATFKQDPYIYSIGFSVDRADATHPPMGYVGVKRGAETVANLACAESSIVNNFEILYDYSR